VHTNPRSARRWVAIAATVTFAAATATAVTLNATPSQAATCGGYVGLTYDDGPNASNTTALLAALTTAGVQATFFNIGQNAANNPALVQAEAAAGMWVGNHTWDHSDMVSLTTAQMDSEISQTQAAIQAGGAPAPKLFRPPYGNTNATLKAEEAKFGLTEVLWDIDTQDWNGATTDAIVAAAAQLQGGQVILMHDGYPNTVAAVPQIVAGLKSRGLCAGMISTATGRAVAPDGSTPPATTAPTSAPASSAPPTSSSGGCLASYAVVSKWAGGFQAGVTVTNRGTSALNGWTVQLSLPAGQSISSLWDGVNSGTSGAVTVRNAAYNGTVAAGGSTMFGYVGTGDGTQAPTAIGCTSP
jgi:peptidoglycan/xylan/chitin deacetylase (PgdA/CDA1 family)